MYKSSYRSFWVESMQDGCISLYGISTNNVRMFRFTNHWHTGLIYLLDNLMVWKVLLNLHLLEYHWSIFFMVIEHNCFSPENYLIYSLFPSFCSVVYFFLSWICGVIFRFLIIFLYKYIFANICLTLWLIYEIGFILFLVDKRILILMQLF